MSVRVRLLLAAFVTITLAGCSGVERTENRRLSAVEVAVGDNHTCAIDAVGAVWCWGENRFGQLGTGDATDRTRPARVRTDVVFRRVAAGDMHTCAIDDSGGVWCWGANFVGRLGTGDLAPSNLPKRVESLPAPARTVSVTTSRSCALLADASVWCWGNNSVNWFWSDPRKELLTPGQMPLAPVLELVVRPSQNCVLYTQRDVECAGMDWVNSQEGEFFTSGYIVPDTPEGLSGITMGRMHGCGLVERTVWCWGMNQYQQVGPAGWTVKPFVFNPPAPVEGLEALQVAAGEATTCVLTVNGEVRCWGVRNPSVPTTWDTDEGFERSATPWRIEGLQAPVRKLASAINHFCAIDEPGTVWCWGANGSGQLGDGTTTGRQHAAPVLLPGP